jgi:preprotein translocase SecE subunit
MAFFAELKTEVKKVDWPTKSRVAQMTAVVFLIVVLMTTLIFIFDFVLGALLLR